MSWPTANVSPKSLKERMTKIRLGKQENHQYNSLYRFNVSKILARRIDRSRETETKEFD